MVIGRREIRGFTLVEMLVAAAILIVLSTLLVPGISDAIKKDELATTRAEMIRLTHALQEYGKDHWTLPTVTEWNNQILTTGSGTLWRGPYIQSASPGDSYWQDRWGVNYVYQVNTQTTDLWSGAVSGVVVSQIVSNGPDKTAGGGDDITMVVNIVPEYLTKVRKETARELHDLRRAIDDYYRFQFFKPVAASNPHLSGTPATLVSRLQSFNLLPTGTTQRGMGASEDYLYDGFGRAYAVEHPGTAACRVYSSNWSGALDPVANPLVP